MNLFEKPLPGPPAPNWLIGLLLVLMMVFFCLCGGGRF